MKDFLTKFFPVEDFWYRFEWQFRGSPHIHGLLWLSDAPDCSQIGSLEEDSRGVIVDYSDSLVSPQIGQIHDIAPHENPCRLRITDLRRDQEQED